MTEDTPSYDGFCPDHGRVYSNDQEPGPPYGCTWDGCRETIEWKKREEEEKKETGDRIQETEVGLHYLILRYNSGLVEVFKGDEYRIRVLFASFRDILDPILSPGRILFLKNHILDTSDLHSVQMVDDEKVADSLSFPGREGEGDPYWYPELKEKNTEDRRQE